MQINLRQYPHPVLSYFSDDLIGCAFQSSLKIKSTRTNYIFEAKFKTSCPEINSLIEQKKAYFAMHIECSKTRMRSLFRTYSEDFSFEIPTYRLDGKVEICSFILAAEDIENYYSKNFNPDYGNTSFYIKKGDVLAVDRDRVFVAEKEKKNIPSIFAIRKSIKEDPTSIEIDTSGDKIYIYLSLENYNRYKLLSKDVNLHPILASLFIIPALTYLLEYIKSHTIPIDELEEYRWFRVLSRRLKEIGLDYKNLGNTTDSSITIAQRLIGEPINTSLKALEEICFEE